MQLAFSGQPLNNVAQICASFLTFYMPFFFLALTLHKHFQSLHMALFFLVEPIGLLMGPDKAHQRNPILHRFAWPNQLRILFIQDLIEPTKF